MTVLKSGTQARIPAEEWLSFAAHALTRRTAWAKSHEVLNLNSSISDEDCFRDEYRKRQRSAV
jgi:hypothetical protein